MSGRDRHYEPGSSDMAENLGCSGCKSPKPKRAMHCPAVVCLQTMGEVVLARLISGILHRMWVEGTTFRLKGGADDLIEFALEHEALTTREPAVKYTDEKQYFISGSAAYPLPGRVCAACPRGAF